MIKHVWFDTSGTLYRLTPEFKTFHGRHLYSTYARVVGEPDLEKAKKDYDRLLAEYASNSAVFDALGMEPGFWQREFASLDVNSTLHPDSSITETLEAIKKVVPISIFTNLRESKLQDLLRHLEIPLEYFTHILTSEQFALPKPNLEGFRKMIELSGARPDELLYVGDKVDKDIVPAKSLGIKTCLVWSSSPEADYSAPDFSDLRGVVGPLTDS